MCSFYMDLGSGDKTELVHISLVEEGMGVCALKCINGVLFSLGNGGVGAQE